MDKKWIKTIKQNSNNLYKNKESTLEKIVKKEKMEVIKLRTIFKNKIKIMNKYNKMQIMVIIPMLTKILTL